MANKNLFRSAPTVPEATVFNSAGGVAYKASPRQTLAQIACTNTFNGTFYVDADATLRIAQEAVMALRNDPQFIAKVAIYARENGYMKDMPAFLTAVLAMLDYDLFRKVFPKVIDNGKMLRNFVQIGRSGAAGRVMNMSSQSLRRAIGGWFAARSSESIFRASIGNDPSMKDVLKMARPRPENEEKAALYAYLCGARFNEETGTFQTVGKNGVLYEHSFDALPELVRQYENYKRTKSGEVPKVDFRLLDSLDIGTKEWTEIARNAGWQMTRMNLNTFERHGVFKDSGMVRLIADRLRNQEEIAKARVFPYQLMMAFLATENGKIPHEIREALQDAMEIAIDNVPLINGQIVVALDVSGSMKSAVTGNRPGATSAVRCVDVASLFAASVLRRNRAAEVIPFDTSVYATNDLNGRDSVMTNARKLARYGGGGTNCSLVLEYLNQNRSKADAVVYVSDNESWVDSRTHYYGEKMGTAMMEQWQLFHRRNPDAKLVCIDLTPRPDSQVTERKNILQCAGFSDTVFDVVASFVKNGANDSNHWVAEIEKISLD